MAKKNSLLLLPVYTTKLLHRDKIQKLTFTKQKYHKEKRIFQEEEEEEKMGEGNGKTIL